MPSLWDLLCVSRQKYTTQSDSGKPSPHHRWVDSPRQVEYKLQPQCHSQPDSRDSFSWFPTDDRQSTASSVTELHGPGSRSRSFISSWMDRSAGDTASDSKRPMPQAWHLAGVLHSRRRNKVESEERKKKKQEAAHAGRRRHVQDIFTDNSQYHDASLRSHNTSSASLISSYSAHSQRSQKRSADKPRRHRGRDNGALLELHADLQSRARRKSSKDSLGAASFQHNDSMYQYTPRSVDDNAISAALFGKCQDDFVHDPAWNLAMGRFAASPTSTSTSSFSFSEQHAHRASNGDHVPSVVGQPSAGVCRDTARRLSGQDSRSPECGRSYQRIPSQGSDGNLMYVVPEVSPPSPRDRGGRGSVSHSGITLTSSMLGLSSDADRKPVDCRAADRNHNSFFTDLVAMRANDYVDLSPSSEGHDADMEHLLYSSGDVLY